MRFRARKTFRFGPYYRTYTTNGFTSHGFRVWRFNFNLTRKTWSIDTPGLGSLHGGGRR